MKLLFLPIVSLVAVLPFMNNMKTKTFPVPTDMVETNSNKALTPTQQSLPSERITAVSFKAQDFCRAELKDFEFDARFTVISATVYFTGANFPQPKKGLITSSSLKPIKELMKQCIPGSVVTFDDIKVAGPDGNRTIDGVTYVLQ